VRFQYKAIDKKGKLITGFLEAKDKAEILSQLEAEELTPLVIKRQTQFKISFSLLKLKKKIPSRDIIIFTQSLSSLLTTGVSLDKALRITSQVLQNSPLVPVIERIIEEIKGGSSLSAALSKEKKIFPELYISMIKAGETGGVLDTVLEGLSGYLEKSYEFKNNLISSLIYPVLLLLVSILSLAVLTVFVVPKFMAMFESMDIQPPLPIVIAGFIGNFIGSFWWIFTLVFVGIYIYFKNKIKRPDGKLWKDEKILKIPFINNILLKIENSRFARTLGVLLNNGVPILQSLLITKEIIGNEVLKREVELIYIGVREGEKFVNLLNKHKKHWHSALLSLAGIGEETGRLGEMLIKCADILEKDVEEGLKKIVSMAEPVTIIFMGILVGSLIISMLTAIFGINETVF